MELLKNHHLKGRPRMDITTLAREVLNLVCAEGIVLTEDLTALETAIRHAVLRVGAAAVELHLADKPLGYEGSSRACDHRYCSCNQKFVGYRPRTLATLLGQVTIRRAYYHCGHCGTSCCPYDVQVGLGTGQQSIGLAKAATLAAALEPFVPAAVVLAELTGQRLGDRTVHRTARQVGRAAAEREGQEALVRAAWGTLQATEGRPRRLYVAVDGVMVHRQQWNEAKCVTCYWEESDGKGGVLRHSRYTARFESIEQFREFVWSLAMRCGLESAAEVVLLGDGAAWIWDHVAGVLGERTICITDWYHVMEHLWAAGNTLLGQGTEPAAAWVKERETLLWEGQYPKVLELLDQERRRTRSRPKHQALVDLAGYLANQGKRLNYAAFRAKDYDIGSGRVESACKHLVATRMKRSGMIWSDHGAQHLLSLRSTYINGWWDRLWNSKPLLSKTAA
jgi:hypothetical protein